MVQPIGNADSLNNGVLEIGGFKLDGPVPIPMERAQAVENDKSVTTGK